MKKRRLEEKRTSLKFDIFLAYSKERMLLVRLVLNRGVLASRGSLSCLHGSVVSRCCPSLTVVNSRYKATQKGNDNEIDLDAPIKFSTSRAANWNSHVISGGAKTEVNKRPWYEPYVVIISMTVFMVYFFILREESSIDQKFSQTLYEHIPGLEEKQLQVALEHSISATDTSAIKSRLSELQQEKLQQSSASGGKA